MRRPLALVTLLVALPAASSEPQTWNFRVLLDGRDVGEHRFTVRSTAAEREVRSEARFDVRLLIVNAYRYRHEAVERWEGNCLRSVAARTETNGDTLAVAAASKAGRLVVERPGSSEEHEGCVMSFAYWNPQILAASRLLNPQTGEVLPVKITPQGAETLSVRGERRAAQRHRIDARDLQIDLWYADGRWVALEAPVAGGRRLRYELVASRP
jgi:hypothetical protein